MRLTVVVIRIHMLSQRLPPESITGAPLQAIQLARALQECGDSLCMYTTLPHGLTAESEFTQGLEVRPLSYLSLGPLRPVMRLAIAFRAASEIGSADIVHGHALSPMILGYALGKDPKSAPFLVKPSLGGGHSEGEVHKLRRLLPTRLLQRAFDRIEAFAVLDDVIAADLKDVGVSDERMHRVPNGVDTQRFYPADNEEVLRLRASLNLPAQAPLLLFAGQLSPRKGIPELLSAWTAQVERGEPGMLLICGGGPLRDLVLETQAALPDSVRYMGELADPTSVMRAADLLILPSRWESFGNVVTEAMACGLPVAATATGIATEIVCPKKTGWRIPEVSFAGLKETLEHIFHEREQWEVLGKGALAQSQHYDFKATAARYQAIYSQLTNA